MFSQLHVIWQLMRGYRLRYSLALACLLGATLLNYGIPLVGSATIDHAIVGRAPDAETPRLIAWLLAAVGGPENLRDNLWLAPALMVALSLLSGVFSYLKGWQASLASDGIARRLKNNLYDHLNHLPARHHDRNDTGDLVQRCTSDVETTRQFLATQVMEIGNAVVLTGVALPLLWSLNVKMTLLSFALIGPIVLYGYIYFRQVKHVFKAVDEAEGALTAVIQENLTGIRVVRAFARQEFERAKFAAPNARYRDTSLRMLRLMSWYWSISDFVALSQLGLTLIVGAHWVTTGEITVGLLFAFLTYLSLMLWPVRQMGRILTDLGKTSIAVTRIKEILAVAHEPEPATTPDQIAALPAISGRIAVRDLHFHHGALPSITAGSAHATADDGRTAVGGSRAPSRDQASSPPTPSAETARRSAPSTNGVPSPSFAPSDGIPPTASTDAQPGLGALNGISFDVHPGETLAILGPSGAGKSTLMHLLLRLYDYTEGSVQFDGRELSSLPRKWLRGQIGVVMQEPFLFSKSLKDNLRLGRGDAPDHEIEEAARAACIHDTILTFEQGYGTLIGERGITLSGGQRQRVAIARAILKRPPLLILDDALSAVDGETESLILDALKQRRGKATTLVIAHRLSTLAQADRVIVLDHGKIIQAGTHAELSAQDGLYRRLWQIQTNLATDFQREQQTR